MEGRACSVLQTFARRQRGMVKFVVDRQQSVGKCRLLKTKQSFGDWTLAVH